MNDNEIVKALHVCGHDGDCHECPAFSVGAFEIEDFTKCHEVMQGATTLIESLQAQLAEKDAEIKRLNDESPAYKFYYCESEDSYLLGYRVGNFYYAHWHDGIGFVFDMSQYLPWGEHVVEPHTAWKEHTYPSEPKEIDSSEWFKGFLAQQLSASQRRERDARNELCLKCGKYRESYMGACDGCRWKGEQK